jgi:hypothetical protein
MKRLTILLILVAVGCARPENRASSDTLPSIDTVKAATAVVAPDTTTRAARTTSTVTPPPSTKTPDSIIGRDSAIRLDPKKPRLPVKRPPIT